MKKMLAIAGLVIALVGCSTNQTKDDDGSLPDVDAIDDTVDGDAVTDSDSADEGRDGVVTDLADAPIAADATDATGIDVDDVPELPVYDEPTVRVLFDLLGKQVESPFPSNHYITPEDGTIRLSSNGYNNSALYLIEMDIPKYAEDAARSNRFALYSPLVFMTSTQVDQATIPADGGASLAADSSVKLFKVEGDTLAAQPIKCVARQFVESRTFNITQCRPLYLMKPDSTYLFVVTDGVRDVDGNAFQRSRGFMQALGLARIDGEQPEDRLALMHRTGDEIDAALELMDDSSHVAAASVFTTGHPNTEIAELMSLFKKDAPIQPVDYILPTDDQGQEIIYDGASLPECPLANEYMAWGLQGIFHAPEFRDADGNFERDGTGAFKTFSGEDIPFILMVPEGEGPFPVVIAQHGMQGDEGSMCDVGRELVRRDIAVMSFLWPGHGGTDERGNGSTDFLDVLNPLRIAYNFMQSATEIASAVILLDQINADLAALRPEGEGLPPLDTSRIGYVGMSLGSIIGLMYLPFSDRIDLMVSNVGGVGMSHLVEQFLQVYFPGLYMGAAVTNLSDHIVAIGDGVSNAGRIFAEPVEWASGPKYLLAQEVIGDEVVANAATEVLARNAGLKLINPVAVPIEGVEAADPATLTSGLFQFVGTNHHQFTNGPGDPVPDTERFQAWHYLETGLKNGVPEIKVFEPVAEENAR